MPKQKPRGRPAKFTPQIQEKILTVLTVGAYRSDACHYVGIQYETLRAWLRRGERETRGAYFEFAQRVKQAEAAAALKAFGTVRTAMDKNWQAAAWYLERKNPQEWGNRQRHEHTGKDGGPIRTQLRIGELPPDQRRARLDAIARRIGIDCLSPLDSPGLPPGPPLRIEGPQDAAGTGRDEPA